MCVAPPVCLVSLFTRKQGLTVCTEGHHRVPYCDLAHHLESRVRASCRVLASSGLAIADFPVIMRCGFTAKRCRTCGLLKFGRQGPGEDACRCCACVSTTCSHTPGNCLQRIKTYGAHRCPSCLKVYGIKRREQLRGNLSAISNIDGQLHPVLLNTNDVDDRDAQHHAWLTQTLRLVRSALFLHGVCSGMVTCGFGSRMLCHGNPSPCREKDAIILRRARHYHTKCMTNGVRSRKVAH